MILNLNKAQCKTTANKNLLSSQSFLKNNKITVNDVVQSHFTVEGVQMYSPNQIQSLKQKQQRTINSKKIEGINLQPKLYQMVDFFDQFQQQKEQLSKLKNKLLAARKSSALGATQLQKEIKQPKQIKPLKAKERLIENNNVIAKLQKQKNKKDAIQHKLQKLSKKYKEFFHQKYQNKSEGLKSKNSEVQRQNKSSLCQSINKIVKQKNKKYNEVDQDSQDGLDFQSQGGQQKNIKKNMNNFRKENKVLSAVSTKITSSQDQKKKVKVKANKNKRVQELNGKQQNKQCEREQSEIEFEDIEEAGFNLVGQIFKNKSSYSQKIGTAMHELFK